MMEDVYLEYLIKKKAGTKDIILKIVLITAAVLVSVFLFLMMFAFNVGMQMAQSAFGQIISFLGLLLIAGVWYGVYLLNSMMNIEYEYILTNSEMDIDKVMSKRGRKNLVSFDFKGILICARIDDNEHADDYNKHIDTTYDAVGDYNKGNVYFVDYMEGSNRIRVLFQPTYKMITSAKKFNPRNIFVKED